MYFLWTPAPPPEWLLRRTQSNTDSENKKEEWRGSTQRSTDSTPNNGAYRKSERVDSSEKPRQGLASVSWYPEIEPDWECSWWSGSSKLNRSRPTNSPPCFRRQRDCHWSELIILPEDCGREHSDTSRVKYRGRRKTSAESEEPGEWEHSTAGRFGCLKTTQN